MGVMSRFGRAVAVVALVAYASSLQSCSFLMYDRSYKSKDPSQGIECQGYATPIIDLVLSLAFGGATAGCIYGYFNIESEGKIFSNLENLAMVSLAIGTVILTIVYGASSITGFVWESDCRGAQQKHQEWLQTVEDPIRKGRMRAAGNYADGKKDGPWIHWYANGQKRIEARYCRGKPCGEARLWDDKGNPRPSFRFRFK